MRLLISVIALLQIYSLQAQVSDSVKYWNSKEKLTWSDFKGVTPKVIGPKERAATATAYYAASSAKTGFQLTITVMFLRYESWTIDTTSRVLNHEQLHFDIAEDYARKMRRGVSQMVKKGAVNKELSKYIQDMIAEEQKFQDTYDNETAHGINSDQQLLWNRKIDNEMRLLAGYASDHK